MTVSEVVPALLAACPRAQSEWQKHLRFWGEEEPGDYNNVGVFASHVVDSCLRHGRNDELAAFFDVVEDMIVRGDERVRELATIGLIEDIQNVASWHEKGAAGFVPWLGPRTTDAWMQVQEMWRGVGSLAEMIQKESQQPGAA